MAWIEPHLQEVACGAEGAGRDAEDGVPLRASLLHPMAQKGPPHPSLQDKVVTLGSSFSCTWMRSHLKERFAQSKGHVSKCLSAS